MSAVILDLGPHRGDGHVTYDDAIRAFSTSTTGYVCQIRKQGHENCLCRLAYPRYAFLTHDWSMGPWPAHYQVYEADMKRILQDLGWSAVEPISYAVLNSVHPQLSRAP